ncbi:hypothetical protein [Roseicella aerolata]|uniref:Uncharacterized protein n=1 Tax=Roseicella aerolata TaxID=2883479 RepID=A0A9X1IEE6_9PROT|nr:hypothetical protein [Roseicella aerolata]MCB4822569.1 hypothetical protein [Roseicella aerolata]
MTPSLLLAALPVPALPVESALVLTLAAAAALMAALGPAEAPPPAEASSAAIFALHGHV